MRSDGCKEVRQQPISSSVANVIVWYAYSQCVRLINSTRPGYQLWPSWRTRYQLWSTNCRVGHKLWTDNRDILRWICYQCRAGYKSWISRIACTGYLSAWVYIGCTDRTTVYYSSAPTATLARWTVALILKQTFTIGSVWDEQRKNLWGRDDGNSYCRRTTNRSRWTDASWLLTSTRVAKEDWINKVNPE